MSMGNRGESVNKTQPDKDQKLFQVSIEIPYQQKIKPQIFNIFLPMYIISSEKSEVYHMCGER